MFTGIKRSIGSMIQEKSIIVTLCVIALVAAGVTLWRSRPHASPADSQTAELTKVASAAFEAAPMVRLSDREQVRIALASAPVGPPPGFDERELKRAEEAGLSETPDAKQTAALVDLITTWIELEANADADAYASWMRSRGYHLKITPLMVKGYEFFWMRNKGYTLKIKPNMTVGDEYFVRELMPDDHTDEAIFRFLFENALAMGHGQIRPVALATGPDVLRVQTLRATDVDSSIFFPTSEQQLFWLGGDGIFTDQMWVPPVQIADLVERDGDLLTAVVLMGCKGATGQWFPLLIYTYLDQNANEWHIKQVLINNAAHIDAAFTF